MNMSSDYDGQDQAYQDEIDNEGINMEDIIKILEILIKL